jgi:hypothetical protein
LIFSTILWLHFQLYNSSAAFPFIRRRTTLAVLLQASLTCFLSHRPRASLRVLRGIDFKHGGPGISRGRLVRPADIQVAGWRIFASSDPHQTRPRLTEPFNRLNHLNLRLTVFFVSARMTRARGVSLAVAINIRHNFELGRFASLRHRTRTFAILARDDLSLLR